MSKNSSQALSAIEAIDSSHDVSTFESGKEALDGWLKKYALTNHKSDSTKTYVVHRGGQVVGYYNLSAGSIAAKDASARASAGQPRRGNIPVALLARLAVDLSEQKKGLGKALLKDALLRCEQAADIIGVRAVLVHALDQDAVDFYKKYDFEPSPVDEMTLMLLMKDLRGNMK